MDNDAVVLLIDDDDTVRASVLKALREAGLRARAFASGREFFDQTSDVENACVVTDLRMADMDGAAVLRRLRETGRTAWPVIVITGHADVPQAVQMMKAGVIDFIEKPFDPVRLIESVRGALSILQETRMRQATLAALRERYASLTDRERQVFAELITGRTNKEISNKYNASVRTVEVHRSNVMKKMQAETLADLVRLGLSLEKVIHLISDDK